MSTEVINVPVFKQKATSDRKYRFDFADALATGETISSADAACAPAGLTLTKTVVGTDVMVVASASGLTVGTRYVVTCTAHTADQVLPVDVYIDIV